MINDKAAATLLTTLTMGGVIISVGLTGLFLIYFLTQSSLGVKLGTEALAAAASGVEDAKLKIVRDKNFSSAGYPINVGSRSAQVVVCRDSKTSAAPCDTPSPGKDEVTSLGSAFTKRRRLRAILNVTSRTGEVQVESVREIPL